MMMMMMMFECDNDNVDARDRRDGAGDITARRAGACANPIAPEQRAHNEVANSSQLLKMKEKRAA